MKSKLVWAGVLILSVIIFTWLNQDNTHTGSIKKKLISSARNSSNWITISYGDLIDKGILTHNGKSVGQIISKIPQYDDEYKGLAQPYLEPFSILCHDVLLSVNGINTPPLVNILFHYPVGSEQPAWAALFREGHYQLYYNHQLIRVFIKGTDVRNNLEKHRSVVRHAIRDVINSSDTSIKKIEVYVFSNDYASTEIKLNTTPTVFTVDEFDLSPRRKSIDLSSIENFLSEGIIMEAVEVDSNNDLYFYGRRASGQTLAGSPVSLSDIAVIYRSIFHYGNNSPYISLDNHEDNRYAKVNFGGHLGNTHAGYVVLEADKLFKTLSTGVDPNTHKLVKSNITKSVPGFLTEDERQLLVDSGTGHVQIRYWFYPDEIGTITDGSIGAVLSYQFLADVERMDTPISVDSAVRETIDHLNNNFNQYENAFPTFKELSTAGRIMALIMWLEGMGMIDRIELDDFLSVKIPAFTTPDKTKKMLAVTAISYPKYFDLSVHNVKNYSKVYYISNLLDRQNKDTSDKDFLKIAGDYSSQLDISKYALPRYNELQSNIVKCDSLIKDNEEKIESLKESIKHSEYSLNRYSSSSLDQHNWLVDEYNTLLLKHESNIDECNLLIKQLNSMNIVSRVITSVGGGINLRPKSFKRISRSKSSPQIKEIARIKGQLRPIGKIAKVENWIRSSASKGEPRINKLPTAKWITSTSSDGSLKYNYRSEKNSNVASVIVFPNPADWQSDIAVNGTHDYAKFTTETNSLQVIHSEIGVNGTGRMSSNGKMIVFTKRSYR